MAEKIADLFASLGLDPDKKGWDKAQRALLRHGEQTQRKLDQMRGRSERNAFRARAIEMQTRVGELDRQIAASRKRHEDRTSRKGGARGMLGKNVGSYSNLTRGLVPFGMNPAALAGVVGAGAGVAAGRDALRFDDMLTRLDVSSRGAMGSLGGVRERILAVSRATGVAKEDILGGAQSFVALTGDGKAATEAMETFAKVQKATGAQTSEIAATAAALSQQLGISGGEMEQAFSILARGGKEGSVEFSDMANLMSSLSASFKGFGQSQGLEGVAQLGAMFQIARKDFGGAAETATGLERLMQAFTQKRTIKAFKELGIEIFRTGKDGKVSMAPLAEIIDQMAKSKLVTDPRVMTEAFESSEAQRAARAILNNVDAVKALAAGTMQAKDISEDYAKIQMSASAKVAKTWNEIKVSVMEAFTPERLQAFAAMLGDIVDGASRLPGFFESVFTLGGKVNKAEAGAEVDRRMQAGESLENIAGDTHGGQFGNVRREAQRRLIEQKGDTAGRGADKVLAEFQRYKESRGAAFGQSTDMRTVAADVQARQAIARTANPPAPEIHNTISVTVPPGSDANGIAKTVTVHFAKFWDSKMREGYAGTGANQ